MLFIYTFDTMLENVYIQGSGALPAVSQQAQID